MVCDYHTREDSVSQAEFILAITQGAEYIILFNHTARNITVQCLQIVKLDYNCYLFCSTRDDVAKLTKSELASAYFHREHT
jgi:hypothetical protein